MGYSANSYLKVLDNNILSIQELGIIFTQDNTSIHGAKKVRKWFEDNGIKVMNWPPCSPDLNPIENLWFKIKYLVNIINHELQFTTGNSEEIRERFKIAI